ncbi:Acyl transferase domain-containing protein [Micromonospora eburnea]|uniref:Acyl transferase domain-containing protein n=2 Tax=Micromonospora eburnea TaxID=227316 RepID=A0A1C6UIN6_9ACTN|nr:type I polyketide synthase [Micromonospora eburnea]SCL53926.1 Acyl transferase domain-containing protein [Micromonospora eburnea]
MDEEKYARYLKRVTGDLYRTRERLRDLEERGREPIAVVGMACRYPGGVRSPEDLWRLVSASRDAVSGCPADRGWQATPSVPLDGSFLPDVADFDAGFFGIAPREARAMDPQQRLLLETAWELFELAGIDPMALRGSDSGVFVGLTDQDYGAAARAPDNGLAGHLLTGLTTSVASGRIAYTFGFQGPALTVDTACSSSMVAVHLAGQSLREGECSLAVAGGAAVMTTPAVFHEFALQGGLAGDGRCKPFAAAADGTGWGEGVGLVLLERLSDARRNGRRVLALLRGSAVNQDGASNGLTAPNGAAQERVIHQALSNARLTPSEVDAVEAHGTGTELGDPIEARALLATYGRSRPADHPLWLGSVKSNIGHTQAAAGVAGLVKMIMAMRHGVLPRTLHVDRPTPHVDWSSGAVRLLTEQIAWPSTGRPRRAAVSSFSISGTNAHVIVEQAPEAEEGADRPVDGAYVPWLLSAKTEEGLRQQARNLVQHVDERAGTADIGLSLATTRAHLRTRAAVVARDRAGYVAGLTALADGVPATGVSVGTAGPGQGGTAFLCAGQGSQRLAMGRVLAEAYPVFGDAFGEMCALFDGRLDVPLREVVFARESSRESELLDQTVFTQAALFAVEVALIRLFASWGLRPDVLAGHSIGEVAAAHVAGVLTAADAAVLVAARGRLMQALPTGGAMVAINATEPEVTASLAEYLDLVGIAAVNGPRSVVISGAEDPVLRVAATWRARGTRTKRLTVSHAFHSPLMTPMLAEFGEVVGGLTLSPPRVPVVSTRTGAVVTDEMATAGYWVRQARDAVRFHDCVNTLKSLGVTRFVEIGPDGSLSAMGRESADDGAATFIPVLLGGDEVAAVNTAVAQAHVAGAAVDWAAFFPDDARRVGLPTYPFRRQRHWPGPPRQSIDSWGYRIGWTRLPSGERPSLSGRWLLVSGAANPFADAVDMTLREHGADVVRVPVEQSERDRDTLAARLRAACQDQGAVGAVSLLALGEDPAGATLTLVNAFGAAGVSARLCCVTRGAVATSDADPVPSPEQAAVWGLGRTAALEHTTRWGGLVDVLDLDTDDARGLLAYALSRAGGEDQVAIRPAGILGRRLHRTTVTEPAGEPWAPTGTTLLVGDLGGLDAEFVRWLDDCGAEHVVLAGAVDRTRLARMLAELPAEHPLTTVIHVGGPGLPVTLAELDAASLRERLTGDTSPDALLATVGEHASLRTVVLFCPLANVFGGVGYGAQAAVAAHCDSLALRRDGQGVRILSLTWGRWAGQHSAGDADGHGLREIAVPLALAALRAAMGSGHRTLLVADLDWTRFLPSYTSLRPSRLVADLPEARVAEAGGDGPPDNRIAQRLAGLSAADGDRLLLDLVRAHAAAVLGHSSANEVGPSQSFRDAGFESLTAVRLRDELATATGLRLPATMVFDHPTPRELAAFLRTCATGVPEDAPVQQRDAGAAHDEPIAIVSMACRYPGGVATPEDLWQLVQAGGDAIGPFPTDRGWDLDRLHHPDPDRQGASYARSGGFVHEATEFDCDFFGISPREALAMDPQQRLLLEASWEVLERARIDPRSMRGTQTGVFAGISGRDYAGSLAGTPDHVAGLLLTGNATGVVSGRVAFTFGFEGPAVTVDTACSSSLVALHLAAQSLRSGECTLALAGGVTVMSTPIEFVEFSRQRGLAPDGRCKSFAAAADGTGFGEGVGVLLLERLSDARRNGHQVLAVVRGSAVNQDGASNGLSAPNGPSQRRVIRQALANSGLHVSDVDVVEAHGTGTTLGDPIEAQALLATYGQRDPEQPLWLGSVKSNIGHTQAAAGVAGVIKMVLALQHRRLPKTMHVDEPTPHVDWSTGAVRLLTEEQEWPPNGRPRRAGVSSFGISGTNAHVIIEESEPTAQPPDTSRTPSLVLCALSARSSDALRAQALRLADTLTGNPDLRPADVAAALATRTRFEHRAVVVAGDREDLLRGLTALARGKPATNLVCGVACTRDGADLAPVLVFPGKGAQQIETIARLLDTAPIFAESIAGCERALAPLVDWSLVDVLRRADTAPPFERDDVLQPVLWAVMVALADLWGSFGVRPAAVVGPSQGEIVAATVAGALSLENAARVVTTRGRVVMPLRGTGGLMSIARPAGEVRRLLAERPSSLEIAVINSPAAVVVAGTPEDLDDLRAVCEARGIRARRMPADYASHTRQLEQVRPAMVGALEPVRPRSTTIPFCSSIAGDVIDAATLDAEYWYRNLRCPVRFDKAVTTLARRGHRAYVEVGTHPVLLAATQENVEAVLGSGHDEAVVVKTLRNDTDALWQFHLSVAEAHVRGVHVDLTAGLPADRGGVVLPTYPFQRRRYWLASDGEEQPVQRVSGTDESFWTAVERADLTALTTTLGVDGDQPFRAVLPALALWRGNSRDRSTMNSWRYRETWTRLGESPATGLPGTWLVVTPDEQAFAELALLRAEGTDVVELRIESRCPDRHELAERLRTASTGHDFAGVLSALALDEERVGPSAAVPRGFANNVTLMQALGDADVEAPLWCFTRGAVATGATEPLPAPAQALVWGLGRVMGLEHPDRWGGVIDLPVGGTTDRTGVRRMVSAVLVEDEDQLAVRDSGVYVRRLARAPLAERGTRTWRPSGTVLITGGTGSLGAHVARWLARSGAEHLVLTSRRGQEFPGATKLAAELAGHGCAVTTTACDVGDRDAVRRLLADLPPRHPLTAVVHAAGVLDDAVVEDLTTEQIDRVLHAKMTAALNLHELTSDLDLQAFVLFSSAGATFGAPGQGNYAPGNAFLDALARHRRAAGLPATSVAWGAWQDSESARGAVRSTLDRFGTPALDTRLAIEALAQVLAHDEVHTFVADIRWNRYLGARTAVRPSPLFDDIPEVAALRVNSSANDADTSFAARMAASTGAERDRMLVETVRSHTASVLGYDSPDDVGTRRAFTDAGLDSVMAVELRNRLVRDTGCALSATVVFDHPTPAALAEHLGSLLANESSGAATPARAAVPVGEPIAIIGMACRYPGGIESAEELWQLLVAGEEALSELPAGRGWPPGAEYRTGAGEHLRIATGAGGFLHDVAGFDAGLFGISPREALAMDPQQRLLLEVTWEALERAGIDPTSVRGSHTSVFAGVAGSDYATVLRAASDSTDGHLMTGNATSVVAGRVSYAFGFEGPAVTVDTACSSSLVALHLAAQSLRGGECSLALAGGVTVMATPEVLAEFSRQGALAADGRCKAFAESADGTGLGEGVGILLLERLSDARRNGHPVLAVLRGSAVNQDGASNGLTAPNGLAQQRVIQQALANAGLRPSDVDVVEAHGTGTALGDPIEAQALLATYGQRDPDRPLWLGSVKSNIGHTQAAAGVAGVIKMVLALRHGRLPRTLHVDEPSRHVDWSAGAVRLLTEERDWSANGRPRRAGVSSFGISGTNAHVIIEHVPDEAGDTGEHRGLPLVPCVVSGRTDAAMRAGARRLHDAVAADPDLSLVDIGFTAATTRAALEHRGVVLATGREELLAGLDALADRRRTRATFESTASDRLQAFVFPGQGEQRPGVGAALHARFLVFADAFDEVCEHFDRWLDQPLATVMFAGPDSALAQRTDYAQAGALALGIGLYRLLGSWGAAPDYVMGHSIGEVVAGCVSGLLPISDAVDLVAARGRLMRALPPGGVMVSLRATEDEVVPLLTAGVSLAAVNGPNSVVLSGDEDAVTALVDRFAERKTRRLRVGHAFHSARMDGMLDEFRGVVEGVSFRPAAIPLVSTVTGRVATAEELADPEHWVRNVRETVRFADAVTTLAGLGVGRVLELGPTGVLSAMGAECVEDGMRFVPALRADAAEQQSVVRAVAELHACGASLDWPAFFAGTGAHRTVLPTYPFQRRRYWPTVRQEAIGGGTWRYRVSWKPVPDEHQPKLHGTWLLVTPDGRDTGWTTRVADGIAARGAEVVPLRMSDVRPERAILAKRLADLTDDTAPAGIVLAAPVRDGADPARPVAEMVLLVQALGDAGIESPLWCVTSGAVSVGDTDPVTDPVGAQLWGLGRAVALEHPRRWGGLVDLPERVDDRAVDRLVHALCGASGEDQLAVRADGLHARRLAPAEPAGPSDRWQLSGTALVTGGTGALGARVARWLAGRGADHLVLVSRRGMAAPGAPELAAELTAGGVRVTITACDVADHAALAAVIEGISDDCPLTAVVHAAGVLANAPVDALDVAAVDAAIDGKVRAAINLHDLTKAHDLTAFVLFSSIAGVWGSGNQGLYAASNAFLDALASQRRAEGLPGTSIAWGAWDGGGLATGAPAVQLRRRGIRAMAPEAAVRELGAVLDQDETFAVVADVDWARFVPSFTVNRRQPLIEDLPQVRRLAAEEETGQDRRDTNGTPPYVARLAGLPAEERARVLAELVRDTMARVLGHDGTGEVSADAAFRDLGLDSLTAVEMRTELADATGLKLPTTVVFDHPTPAALAAHLDAELHTGVAVADLPVLTQIEALEAALARVTRQDTARTRITTRLRHLMLAWGGDAPDESGEAVAGRLATATDEEMFDFIQRELGTG